MIASRHLAAMAAVLALSGPAIAEEVEMQKGSGAFEVEVKPVSGEGESHARMALSKTFTGDLTGTSIGQMIAGGNEANGARVYVALETVTGSLGGKQGSFIVTHRGTMTKDGQDLSIIIVPDSGTDELSGIEGTMDIQNIDGKHSYTIDYSLPEG